ncbi:MAG: hypothetical protein ABWY04_13040 [Arthrobacter sp.]
MRIPSAEVLVSRPGRNLVTLRITTEYELAAGFDNTPAYLPAARPLAGTVHDR